MLPRAVINILIFFSQIELSSQSTVDVALHKSALQSSTFANRAASYAVDGDDSSCSVAGIGSHSTMFAWWQVDLGSTYEVKFVEVKNTLDFYESQYLSNFHVIIGANSTVDKNEPGSNVCYSYFKSSKPGERLSLQCSAGSIGRYVTITRFGGFRTDALSLCDVKVLVEQQRETDERSIKTESSETQSIDLNPKLALQSKTFSNFGANLALDRNNETCSIAGVGSDSKEFGWWAVDLGLVVNVSRVTILNSKNYYESMFLNQFEVYVDMKISELSGKCASFYETFPVPAASTVTLNCSQGGVLGQYLSIKRTGGFRQDALSLCEVYVFGSLGSNATVPRTDELTQVKVIRPLSWLQSSIFSTYTVDLAFDENPDTCFIIGEGSDSRNFAWLTLDLGATYIIQSVLLRSHYNFYEASFLNQLEISADSKPDTRGLAPDRKICFVLSRAVDIREDVKVTCNGNNTFGRFLSMRRLGGFRQDALAACEIKINVLVWVAANSSETETIETEHDIPSTFPLTRTTPTPVTSTTTTTTITTTTIRTPTTTTTTPTTSTAWTETSSNSPMDSSSAIIFTTTSTLEPTTSSIKSMVCPDGYVKCFKSDFCVSKNNVCDGWNDCEDESDELNCDCNKMGRFRCENSKCIQLAWICDKDDDCGDGSDERNCNCSISEFKCNNGKCVKLSERCNKFDNCGDGSDESQCDVCLPGDFQCDANKCINTLDVCNSQFDCSDGADELNCDCGSGYRCNVTGFCVSKNQICDSIRHCPDNSDEINCSCLDFQYKCRQGPCVHKDWWCDGYRDCPLGDDEENCPTCTADQFVCLRGKKCLQKIYVCDGINDCPDGDDEKNCLLLEGSGNSMNPLKLIVKGEEFYVCNQLWNENWNLLACFLQGLGMPVGFSSINVNSSSKFASLKNPEPDPKASAFVELFSTEVACPSNSVVLLKCSNFTNYACGIRKEPKEEGIIKLVNADIAAEGSWPWHVQVFVNNQFECGGSLIANRWVVTAAHCFDNIDVKTSYSSVFVVMGTNILESKLLNVSVFIDKNVDNVNIQYSNVDEIIKHEKYDEVSNAYDVALLKLSSSVNWTDAVKPACLPFPSISVLSPYYKVCYAIGHGLTYPESTFSRHLLQGRMNILDYDTCIKDIENMTRLGINYINSSIDRNTMLCAGEHPYQSSTSNCRGDSGSPLMCQDMKNRWSIVGLASFSLSTENSKCANSIFANLKTLGGWVTDVLEADGGA